MKLPLQLPEQIKLPEQFPKLPEQFNLNFLPKVNLKLSHKGLIIVAIPLIFEIIFLLTLSALLRQAEIEVQRQIRSKAIISQANTLSKLFYDAGVAMGGYSITKSPL